MSLAGDNVVVCHRCENRRTACGGMCIICLPTGQDIVAHASAGYCPLKIFGTGVRPEGWHDDPVAKFNARPTHEIPEGFNHANETGGCGCDPPKA